MRYDLVHDFRGTTADAQDPRIQLARDLADRLPFVEVRDHLAPAELAHRLPKQVEFAYQNLPLPTST